MVRNPITALGLAMLLGGCYLNSTFQTAEVTEPGAARAGVAVSLRGGPRFEMPARVGIVRNFDLGVKYGLIDHLLIDGKYQILHDPVDMSMSIGLSYDRVKSGDKETERRENSFGFFPTVIVGQTGTEAGWYAGFRGLYLSTAGTEELIRDKTLFGTSGWVGQGIVLGGFIHGSWIRFLTEVNVLLGRNGQSIVVPTVGFQFAVD